MNVIQELSDDDKIKVAWILDKLQDFRPFGFLQKLLATSHTSFLLLLAKQGLKEYETDMSMIYIYHCVFFRVKVSLK